MCAVERPESGHDREDDEGRRPHGSRAHGSARDPRAGDRRGRAAREGRVLRHLRVRPPVPGGREPVGAPHTRPSEAEPAGNGARSRVRRSRRASRFARARRLGRRARRGGPIRYAGALPHVPDRPPSPLPEYDPYRPRGGMGRTRVLPRRDGDILQGVGAPLVSNPRRVPVRKRRDARYRGRGVSCARTRRRARRIVGARRRTRAARSFGGTARAGSRRARGVCDRSVRRDAPYRRKVRSHLFPFRRSGLAATG